MKKRSVTLALVLALAAVTGVTAPALAPSAGASVLAQPCCKGGS